MIVDAHAHAGGSFPDEGVRLTLADTIAMMDRCGVDKACTSSAGFLGSDYRLGNRLTLKAVQEYPDRLIGFAVLSPREAADSVSEADRYLGRQGFKGIKVHESYNNVPYDDVRYEPIYAKAREYHVPVLAHTFNRAEVEQVVAAARAHPEVSFILGHSGGFAWADCLSAIASVPNTYFDVCTSCTDSGRVEAFVAAAGAERVLFGTDLPLLSPAHCLAQVYAAGLDERAEELILGGNILRLLGGVQ